MRDWWDGRFSPSTGNLDHSRLNPALGGAHPATMKIGVLGSGTVGQVLASGFLKHGHEAMLSSRDPHKPEVQKWLGENPSGRTGTFEEAARFCDLAVLATSGLVVDSALDQAGPQNLAGKTLIDATNPLANTPPVEGILVYATGPNESLGERVQAKI